MPDTERRSHDIVLPVSALAALRESLIAELGTDAAAHALQRAGHAAGEAFFAPLRGRAEAGADGHGIAEVPESVFWQRLDEFFRERGWGRLSHERAHPGVGALESPDWAEAESAAGAPRPSCFFTTGLLANLLGRTAGDDVGVLEVECRACGDERCRFLFGGPDALQAVYEDVASGRDAERSLAELA